MKKKKVLFTLLAIITGVVLLIFLLNFYVKQRVENQLSKLEAPVEYTSLGVNVITNNFSLSDLKTRQATFALSAPKMNFRGLSYYKFLFKDQLVIDEIEMEEPSIRYFSKDSVSKDTSQKRNFTVKSFLLKNGDFSRSNSDTSEVNFFVSFPEIEVKGVENFRNPDFKSYRADIDSVYLKMNAQHYIQIGNIEAKNGRVKLLDFGILPLYSKEVFDQKIEIEKDRISLEVDSIFMENFAVEKLRDTLLLSDSKMTVSHAILEIYRNKLVKDDVRRKPLYNELLRKAPVKLNFKQVLVENSEIIYEEQVQESRQPAIIRFTDVSAEINNLNNLSSIEIPQPKITARANFMRGTPVNLSWTFPVFDMDNSFSISGSFGSLEGEALDPFLVPALDLQARGEINDIHFNFSGNENILSGDFKMNYDDLKVELLKKEGKEKKGFFSAIANLFVENKGEARAEEKQIEVERNKERSFWNFVWLGLRQGFLNTVSQL